MLLVNQPFNKKPLSYLELRPLVLTIVLKKQAELLLKKKPRKILG